MNKGQDAERYKGFGRRQGQESNGVEADQLDEGSDTNLVDTLAVSDLSRPIIARSATEDLMSLEGLDLSAPTPLTTSQIPLADNLPPPVTQAQPSAAPVAKTIPSSTSTPAARTKAAPLTHGSSKWLTRLAYNAEGVLYEDSQLQIGIKSEFHGHLGRIALFFGNKISVPLESFTSTIDTDDPSSLAVILPKMASSRLAPMSQIQLIVQVECKQSFDVAPILNLSYLAGSLQTIRLELPIYLTKFIEPVKLSSADFFERWKQIGTGERESQAIFPISTSLNLVDSLARYRKIVGGSRLGLLEGIDPSNSGNNLVAAGVLHMSSGGKVGCLLRLEPNFEAKVRPLIRIAQACMLTVLVVLASQLCRLTLRSTNQLVSAEIAKTLLASLQATSK